MEQRSTKNYFQFNRGLNTESSEINFPDGFSTDERNYELLVDGSRKRRKGLKLENGGAFMNSGTLSSSKPQFTTYKWRNVEGNADVHFIVYQFGHQLRFTDDTETPSATYDATLYIDLRDLVVDPNTTKEQIEQEPCQFSQGRGYLLVTHKYCHPFYVDYNEDTNEIIYGIVTINHRDFYGIDDGLANQVTPPQAAFQDYSDLSDDHYYNLRNRGWRLADIKTFADRNDPSAGNYPSKAMIWHSGYERLADESTNTAVEKIGTRSGFRPSKIAAELTGPDSAPQGSLLLNPLDTRYTTSVSNDYGDAPEVQIADWYVTGDIVTLELEAAHGRSNNDFITISGNSYVLSVLVGKGVQTLDGSYEVTVVNSTTLTFTTTNEALIAGTILQKEGEFFGRTLGLGQINGNPALVKSDGRALSVGPTACAYYAGRAWWAGIESPEYSDTLFFSQISQKPDTFGSCFQDKDPTNPNEAGLTAADGGFIVIPGLGALKKMVPMRDSLLVFSDQGVWEVSGVNRRIFTPSNYNVRKVTEAECNSARSPLVIGNVAVYTGPRGIHQIAPNPYTSVLEEQSISDTVIQSFWNDIPIANQKDVQTCYDDALKRVYFLYDDGTATSSQVYKFALILDLRIGGYFKYEFNEGTNLGVVAVFTVTDADSSNSNKKVKFVVQKETFQFDICDLDQTDYVDFDGFESPLPYVLSGWDNVGDFQRRKQAPVVTVYAKRTETGYTETGTGYTGDNESSNLLTAYWDWTDDSISGKIGSQNETYRHTRGFVPTGASDVDGYPVVVTRNKIRGRGRVLQLRFDGAEGKDSHILGFTINYKVTRKV